MIVYCCTDLIFSTKIRSTAEAVGVPARAARGADAVRKRLERADDGKLNEPVTGVLVDLDLGETAMAIIGLVKQADPAAAVIAFGSHVAADALERARQHGADLAMPRSAFAANLPELLRQYGGAVL